MIYDNAAKHMHSDELVNLNSTELLHQLQEAKEATTELGLKWAEAKMRYKNLKELMPSYLATLVMEIMRAQNRGSSEARRIALASDAYKNKLREMNLREFEMKKAEVRYKGYVKILETLQSICYVRNNELKLAR